MTTIKQIAQDPRKALRELEIKLGSNPGELLREMEQLSPPGEEWGRHLSYRVAASYYDDEQTRTAYQAHVDVCDYCKTLLDTLHPTSLEAAEFASRAKRMYAGAQREWMSSAVRLAMAAGVAALAVGGGFFVRSLAIESRIKQLQVGDLKIGSGADAAAATTRVGTEPTFAAGQPVHVVTEVGNAPSHTPVSVVWVGPDNREVRKEVNWTRTDEKVLSFTAQTTAAWKSGEYRAELWVADRKVRQAHFDIQPIEPTEQNQ